jgi:hypothetical protein
MLIEMTLNLNRQLFCRLPTNVSDVTRVSQFPSLLRVCYIQVINIKPFYKSSVSFQCTIQWAYEKRTFSHSPPNLTDLWLSLGPNSVEVVCLSRDLTGFNSKQLAHIHSSDSDQKLPYWCRKSHVFIYQG